MSHQLPRPKPNVVLIAVITGSIWSTASAHHSNFQFDTDAVVTLEGTVTRFEWKNPHIFFHIDTIDENGDRVTLQVEGDGVGMSAPLGWRKDSVQIGDRVTVEASPPTDPERRSLLGRGVVKADGTVLPMNSEFHSGYPEPAVPISAAIGLSGRWLPRIADFYLGFPDGRSHPLTERGRAVAETYDPRANPQYDCIAHAAPRIMLYPAVNAIEIYDDRATLRPDWSNIERVVYMDGRTHPSGGERTPQGHSVGHWEGETLVVDTALFAAHPASSLRGLPVPSSEEKHLVERFTLAEDGTKLIYEILLEDPAYLAEPIAQTHEWDYRPDIVPGEVDCDLDSARRHLTE